MNLSMLRALTPVTSGARFFRTCTTSHSSCQTDCLITPHSSPTRSAKDPGWTAPGITASTRTLRYSSVTRETGSWPSPPSSRASCHEHAEVLSACAVLPTRLEWVDELATASDRPCSTPASHTASGVSLHADARPFSVTCVGRSTPASDATASRSARIQGAKPFRLIPTASPTPWTGHKPKAVPTEFCHGRKEAIVNFIQPSIHTWGPLTASTCTSTDSSRTPVRRLQRHAALHWFTPTRSTLPSNGDTPSDVTNTFKAAAPPHSPREGDCGEDAEDAMETTSSGAAAWNEWHTRVQTAGKASRKKMLSSLPKVSKAHLQERLRVEFGGYRLQHHHKRASPKH